MANQGFGGNEDFEALARQYWSRWGEMLRAGADAAPASQGFPGANFSGAGFPGMGVPGMPGAGAAVPGWNEAVAWWSKLAQGNVGPGAGFGNGFGGGLGSGLGSQADATIDRFNTQARGWYAQMQQLAAQFAGQDADAADIAGAWKRALGGDFGNPFAEVLRGMQGPGQQGFEQWFAQAAPFIEKLQRDGQAWSGMPAFGFTREHQERLQQLGQAQADYQQQGQAYQTLMAEAAQDAFKRFEQKLTERSEPGKQLESARALFDLWIDAAEEAYADIALSPRFRDAYGALVNSQMRLRAAVQGQVEQVGDALGMPTRSEVDAAHRKIVQLERELRRLRDLVAEMPPSGERSERPAARTTPKSEPAVPPRKAAAKKPVAKKAATKKTPASKKASAKKSPSRASVTKPTRKAR
ncbi:class III poly(R)-hydroxyalkanoic acid synthase subunit PhaE [Novilysobacter erysipheiresistens]|uniref:Poly(3-hydroxyalkanoate) polymerase subunit PhaE n=1 Tax=Novilysobacter erysipheiresistens TaxID=1749332 RepID=A0ABU7YVB3_9GAMM